MSDASPKPPPRGVSTTTLILCVGLTATTTAAVVLGVLFTMGGDRRPNGGAPQPFGGAPPFPGFPSLPAGVASPTPFVQTEIIKPQGHPSGEVFYPIPYAAPPHLTLTAPHRAYSIVKQDEYGFSWAADSLLEDFAGDVKDLAAAIQAGTAVKKPTIEYEDFTWEAKGVPAGADVDIQRSFEQSGSFQTVINTQGQQNFEFPYASPPQVALTGNSNTTVIVEATNTGFKWKNGGTDAFFNNGDMRWTAKGIRATKLPK